MFSEKGGIMVAGSFSVCLTKDMECEPGHRKNNEYDLA